MRPYINLLNIALKERQEFVHIPVNGSPQLRPRSEGATESESGRLDLTQFPSLCLGVFVVKFFFVSPWSGIHRFDPCLDAGDKLFQVLLGNPFEKPAAAEGGQFTPHGYLPGPVNFCLPCSDFL